MKTTFLEAAKHFRENSRTIGVRLGGIEIFAEIVPCKQKKGDRIEMNRVLFVPLNITTEELEKEGWELIYD